MTVNLFRNVFYSLWQETVRQRLSRSVELVSRIPSDRTVTSYLTLLLFLSLDKTELYSEKEPFIQARILFYCFIVLAFPAVTPCDIIFILYII